MKFGRAIKYPIVIEPTDNQGFIAKVGCGTFSFCNKDELKAGINEFLDDPDKLEELFNKDQKGPQVTENVRDDRGYLCEATRPVTESRQ